MAVDFEALIRKYAAEDGNIPADAIAKAASAISSAVGREFVAKDRYAAKLDEIETLKADKQTAEDNAAAASKWEKKYKDKEAELDRFKADTDARETLAHKKAAYRKLLEEQSIDARRIDTILRATTFDDMKLTDDGKLDKADDLRKAIDSDWADFKVSTHIKGRPVENPPQDGKDSEAPNPRAAERAKAFVETRYGTAPTDSQHSAKQD